MIDIEKLELYLINTGWKKTIFGYYDDPSGVRLTLHKLHEAIRILSEVEQLNPTDLYIKVSEYCG